MGQRISVYANSTSRAYTAHYRADSRYEVVCRGKGWSVVRSVGTRAHAKVFADGHERVVIWTPLLDGTHAYTVAKRSELVKRSPVPEILLALGGIKSRDGAEAAPSAARRATPTGRARGSRRSRCSNAVERVLGGPHRGRRGGIRGSLTPATASIMVRRSRGGCREEV